MLAGNPCQYPFLFFLYQKEIVTMKNNNKNNVKFSNVDVLSFMSEVVQKHTKYYQSDFEIDKEILLEAAEKQEQQDKTFLWLCRESGTWCLQERNVFLKDTREYNTFRFYKEQTTEPISAFIVEVISVATSVIGNIYVIDYSAYYNHVCTVSLATKIILFQYKHGCRIREAEATIDGCPDIEYGKFLSIQHQPHLQKELAELLWREKQKRKRFVEGDPKKYIANL